MIQNRHQYQFKLQDCPGTRYQVPGTRYQVPGTKYQVPGTRYQLNLKDGPGTMYQVPGTSLRYQFAAQIWFIHVDLPRQGSGGGTIEEHGEGVSLRHPLPSD